jgi:uncharacterized repeat protein (TIGR01451 family)
MRRSLVLLLTVGALIATLGAPTVADLAAAPSGFRGLAMSTPFPSQTVRAGEPVSLSLTIKNYNLPPQDVVTLGVAQISPGWRVSFVGGGRPIAAVSVGTDQETIVTARLDPPRTVRAGTYRFVLVARGRSATASLPIALTFGQVQPAKLSLTAELPVLRGSGSSSFKYRLSLKNDGDQDLLVNLDAQTPQGFQVTFTPAFGSQQVTSLPIKAGEAKDIDTDVTPPQQISAGNYEVNVRAAGSGASAQIKLTLEVTGRPDLQVTTPEGRLSGRAYAGSDTTFTVVVKNRGSAPARNVEVSSFEPTGWKVTFEPNKIAEIKPNSEEQVKATVRPGPKSLTGDYILTLRANAGDVSTSVDYRIQVWTSRLWGVVGLGFVAAAIIVLGMMVSRYGRR